MSLPGAWSQVLDFFGTPLVIEPSPGQLSSDAGLLPARQFDQRIGRTPTFAGARTTTATPTTRARPGSRRHPASGTALVYGPSR